MDKKINFLHTCRQAAAEAEKLFGINARIILAQGALESGWGSSCLATEHHNFFGLMGYGTSNAYWHGQRATFETAYGTHHFRHYEATRLSFLDFARLIRSAYPRAYHSASNPKPMQKRSPTALTSVNKTATTATCTAATSSRSKRTSGGCWIGEGRGLPARSLPARFLQHENIKQSPRNGGVCPPNPMGTRMANGRQ